MRFLLGKEHLDTATMTTVPVEGHVLYVTQDRRRVFMQTLDRCGGCKIEELDPWEVGPWADRTGELLLQEIRVTIRAN